MKTVLLAIDHLTPDRKTLDYALVLCRRMTAGLEVLHLIQPPKSAGGRGQRWFARIGQVRDAFESAMVTATYAEAGVSDPAEALKKAAHDQFSRLLPERTETRIDYRCVITGEPAGSLIERYVRSHRNVALAVFDPRNYRLPSAKCKTLNRQTGASDMPKLPIPLVLVKHAR